MQILPIIGGGGCCIPNRLFTEEVVSSHFSSTVLILAAGDTDFARATRETQATVINAISEQTKTFSRLRDLSRPIGQLLVRTVPSARR